MTWPTCTGDTHTSPFFQGPKVESLSCSGRTARMTGTAPLQNPPKQQDAQRQCRVAEVMITVNSSSSKFKVQSLVGNPVQLYLGGKEHPGTRVHFEPIGSHGLKLRPRGQSPWRNDAAQRPGAALTTRHVGQQHRRQQHCWRPRWHRARRDRFPGGLALGSPEP